MSQILLINDFVSRGKIGGNMVDLVLSKKGHYVYFLPTALISHNFSLGNVVEIDTSKYIEECLNSWTKLNFKFDIILIGYIESAKQKDLIINYINSLSYKPLIILDPIMGDDGSLYQGVGKEKIDIYKDLLKISNIILPNHTEAKLLGLDNFEKLVNGGRNYVITSIEESDRPYTLGISDSLYKVYYEKIDVKYAGTGDLFDGFFLSYYLENNDFNLSIEKAVRDMSKILRIQKKSYKDSDSIIVEAILPEMENESNA